MCAFTIQTVMLHGSSLGLIHPGEQISSEYFVFICVCVFIFCKVQHQNDPEEDAEKA